MHAARVRSAGLRATTPRVLVTSALAELAHPTAEQIHQHLRGTGVNVSTVYRTLTALEQVGLVARFHPDDGIARYHPMTGRLRATCTCYAAAACRPWTSPLRRSTRLCRRPWPRPVTGPTRSS